MRRLIIILCFLIITLSNHFLFGQKTWTFKDNQHSFLVVIDTVLCGGTTGGYRPTVKAIHIYNLINQKQIQTIIPEQYLFDSFHDSSTVFILEDMNFDGTTDIRLLNWTSTNLQTTYWYWFYNDSTKQFQRNTTLAELTNPFFNSTTKTIHTSWSFISNSYGHALYEWNEDKVELIAEEELKWNISGSHEILTIKQNINGKINIIKRDVKEDEIINFHKSGECELRKK